MRLHYFQHVPFESLGSIEPWAKKMTCEITSTRFFAKDPLPELDDIDWLIIMGGPMSAYEDDKYPWFTTEKKYIEQAVVEGKIVLGICLGAQLIADVLGAKVYPNKYKEIGWFPIQKSPDATETRLTDFLPEEVDVFHWHGDAFDTPPGAIHIAKSTACRNQGFIYDDQVIGLQFHLETLEQSARDLIKNCSEEIVDGPFIQSPETMLADKERFQNINVLMEDLLNHLAYVSSTSLFLNSFGIRTLDQARRLK